MGEVIWYFEPQQAKQSPKLQFNVVDALFPVKNAVSIYASRELLHVDCFRVGRRRLSQ